MTLQEQLTEKQVLLSTTQSDLSQKQADLAAIEDIPENTEARQVIQDEIAVLEAQISDIEENISIIEAKIVLDNRITSLEDFALLVEYYFKNHGGQIESNDSWNPAGFDLDNIESSFGWNFQNIPKPTLEQLEQIKLDHFSGQ